MRISQYLGLPNSPISSYAHSPFIIALLATLTVTGCATPKYVANTRYTLMPTIEPAKANPTPKTVAVRPLDAARPYGQPIVCRDPGNVLSQLPNSEWAEVPRDTMTRALVDALVATHHYADVGLALDLSRPDLILTGQLRKFDLVRTSKTWTAECQVRLELREAIGAGLIYADTLTASQALSKNEVAALPDAMSKAVSQIVDAAIKGILSK